MIAKTDNEGRPINLKPGVQDYLPLRERRIALGISIKEMSEIISGSVSSISCWERGFWEGSEKYNHYLEWLDKLEEEAGHGYKRRK